MRTGSIVSALVLAVPAAAQELRHAVAAADAVVVATDVAVQPIGKQLLLHRLEIKAVLGGEVPSLVSVIEIEGVALHQRPVPGEQRLYCLHALPADAHKGQLPASFAPYFKMSGHPGSSPLVRNAQSDPACEMARIVLDSERGAAPRAVVTRLLPLILSGPPEIRTEAVEMIASRPVLLDALGPIELSGLTARAIGETEDIPFKIALAELCAEKKVDGLVDSLCISLDAVEDPRFAEALGRIARRLHGESALDVLRPHIVKPIRKSTRERLLLALGATSTDRALEALLRMRTATEDAAAIDAALRAHGSRRALDAVGKQ